MNYIKPQSPLMDSKKENGIYPLTTVDQILTEDGERLNTQIVSQNLDGIIDNETAPVNADTLNGKNASYYAKKDDSLQLFIQNQNNLIGQGIVGRFKATVSDDFSSFLINDISYTVKNEEDNSINLIKNNWYSFILDNIDNTINFNRGGAGLNFKIVGGTTRPQNPRENTIWINTATAIGEYQFTAAKPERRADGSALQAGDIWVETGYIKTAQEFNALKKNGLQVYPRRAYQWNGTAFILKECRIYTGASWKDLTLYIYDNGWVEGFETKPTLKSNYGNLGSIGFYDTYILVACDGWASNYAEFPLCDITPYTTLEIFFASVSGAVEGLMGFIDGTEIGRSSDLVTAKLTLDISSYTGEHRIGAGGWAGGGGGNYQITAIKLS